MSKERVIDISLSHLSCQPQVREQFDEESLAGLAVSLRTIGQLVPIRVRPIGDRFLIVDGERRFRAAKIAELASLEAVLDERELAEADVILQQLTTNVQRAALVPLEKAKAIDRMMRMKNWNGAQAAGHLGISAPTVTRLLRLLELPADVQQLIDSGRLPASTAYSLLQVDDANKRAELIQAAATGSLTREVANNHVRKSTLRTKPQRCRSSTRTTLCVDKSQTVTVTSAHPSLEHLITLLEDLLSKARKARTSGWELSTLTRALKDQAKGG